MNKKILEKHDMFTNVKEVFGAHMGTIDTVTALKAQVASFQADYSLLDGMMQPLLLDSKGHAKAKANAKEQLSKIGATVCGAIRSLAKDQNDPVLFAKANYSPSALLQSRSTELQQIGQALYDLANSHAAQLVPYGIDNATLEAFKAAVDKFAELSPKVREVRIDNKTLLAQLKAKIKDMNNLLRNKIDNSIVVMELISPEFFELYFNARRNYALGVRHQQNPKEATAAFDAAVNPATAPPAKADEFSAAPKHMEALNENRGGA